MPADKGIFKEVYSKRVRFYGLGIKGFSLLELIMILTLIAILTVVIVPRFGQYYAGIRLGSATTKFGSDIRFAQNRATTTQDRSRFNIANATNYEVLYCSDFNAGSCTCNSSWTYATNPAAQGNFQIDLTTEFSGGTISTLIGDCVEFDSLGRPFYNANCNTSTSCDNSAGATITLQYSGESENITVQTETGTVTFD